MVVGVGSKNITGSFIQVIEQQGWQGLWAGNAINMLRIIPTQAIELGTFEYVKRSMTSTQEKWKQNGCPKVQIGNVNLSFFNLLGLSSCCGWCSCWSYQHTCLSSTWSLKGTQPQNHEKRVFERKNTLRAIYWLCDLISLHCFCFLPFALVKEQLLIYGLFHTVAFISFSFHLFFFFFDSRIGWLLVLKFIPV